MIKSVCWMKMSYCLPCDGFRKYPGGSRWYSFFPHLSLLLVLLPVSFYPIIHHPTPKSPFLHLPSLHAIFDHPILESPFPHLPISHVILEHPILVPSFPHFPSLHALHHHPILDHHILVPPSPHLPTPHAIFDHPILVPSLTRPSSLHAIIPDPADSDAGGAVVALSRRGRNFSAFSLTFSFFFVFLCFFSYFFFFLVLVARLYCHTCRLRRHPSVIQLYCQRQFSTSLIPVSISVVAVSDALIAPIVLTGGCF